MALFLVALAGCGATGGDRTGLVAIGAGLKGPKELKATVYANGVPNVSAFAFDAMGRLWLATSGATEHANDGIYLVPASGASPVKVVGGLKAPLGLTWYRDRLYVASLGRVDALGGFDGTRFASRKLLLTGPVAGGENNNLVLGPDGRLVMGVSAPCDHCTPTSRWSATVVSFRPDGSDLRIYARGIRAGFGLAYYPGTSDLFVSMNQRDDLGAKTPGDWLAVVRRGQSWGFPGCYGQGGAVCRRVPRPLAVLDPHAAAGGVTIVTGQLGATVRTSALVSEWQLGEVLRIALTKSGSTYQGVVQPFLTGLKNPLALIATGDGAVLVGDWRTGIVYRIAER